MSIKQLAILAVLLVALSIPIKSLSAKRLLPHAGSGAISPTTKSSGATSGRVKTSVKFRGDRRAATVTFSTLSVAKSVSYTLSYNTRGTTQGASGSIVSLSTDPTTRELLFGTCSAGVCRYDSGITNAKLVITSILTNGRKVVKTYRLKV